MLVGDIQRDCMHMFDEANSDNSFWLMVEMAHSLFGDDKEELSSQDERKYGGYREYVMYFNEGKAKAAFKSRWPISVIALENGTFAMVIDQGHQMLPVRLALLTNTSVAMCGAAYLEWECDNDPTFFSVKDKGGHTLIDRQILHSCLLLPLQSKEARESNTNYYYYLITSSWKEMLEDRTIRQSWIRGARYDYKFIILYYIILQYSLDGKLTEPAQREDCLWSARVLEITLLLLLVVLLLVVL
jgi:hypothetical protein